MNGTNVSNEFAAADADDLVEKLSTNLDALTPQERKAAIYVLDNPQTVGISSIREIADAAEVKPNTLMRMARSIGFAGYDDFRAPFREQIRNGNLNFPDRARWLQSLKEGGELSGLFTDMASSAIDNIENTFASIDVQELKLAASSIVEARAVYVLGVGAYHTLANNFAYLANMALDHVKTIPQPGSHLVDDLARANEKDVVLAMTFKPYRSEVVGAVQMAKDQGAIIIGISDSKAAPFMGACRYSFVTASDTPQFFPSTVATTALLETLMSFVVAEAGPEAIKSIDRFHTRRHSLGIYLDAQ